MRVVCASKLTASNEEGRQDDYYERSAVAHGTGHTGQLGLQRRALVAVLGMDPTDPPTDGTVDQFSRIGAVLKIDSALRHRFNNPLNVTGFMSMANSNWPFNGATPLDTVAQGEMSLDEVAQHIMHAGEW